MSEYLVDEAKNLLPFSISYVDVQMSHEFSSPNASSLDFEFGLGGLSKDLDIGELFYFFWGCSELQVKTLYQTKVRLRFHNKTQHTLFFKTLQYRYMVADMAISVWTTTVPSSSSSRSIQLSSGDSKEWAISGMNNNTPYAFFITGEGYIIS